MLATALVAAAAAMAPAAASAAQGGPDCRLVDCPPPQAPITVVPPIKWPPGPVCLSCPSEFRDLLVGVVLPARDGLVTPVSARPLAVQLDPMAVGTGPLRP